MDLLLIGGLLAAPALAVGACLVVPRPRAVLAAAAAGAGVFALLAFATAFTVFTRSPLRAAGGWFYVDALSAWHLVVMALVFGLSALFSFAYFADELQNGHLSLRSARQYGGLWAGAMVAMALVLVSNNLAVMWIGIEATTLLTAFLICVHVTPTSLEAMWKYLLVCSVGVAFAFLGTLFTGAAGSKVLHGADTLLWTELSGSATRLDPNAMKAAFLFLLVGYGTKAGLAPMHSWLPDAHSQAPAPVSAIFSGFMLNAALYCVLRYLPLVEAATGNSGWAHGLLVGFGVLSVLIASGFIVLQKDVKRLLAYSSVEHVGAMTLGFGLGGLGTVAALFHMLNHSLGKSLAFFSAGRIGQQYGTHEMAKLAGSARASPVWGATLLGALLALLGAAPFGPFMSEFQIFKAAVAGEAWWPLGLFLAGLAIAFVGAMRHALAMAWGEPVGDVHPPPVSRLEAVLAWTPLALLLLLGLWLPPPVQEVLQRAAAVVSGGRP